MKIIIIAFLIILISISLFANPKIYIADGAATTYNFDNVHVTVEKIGDCHYKMIPYFGDFSDVPFVPNLTTLIIAQFKAIVISKTDTLIEFIGTEDIENISVQWFNVAISNGHATACRSHAIQETAGVIDASDIYVGTIGLPFNLLGVANAFDIDIVSISKAGMSDYHNSNYGQLFNDADKLIVYAHGSNSHIRLTNTTYVGHIVTVSCGDGTQLNAGSYGPGLEFFVWDQYAQSYATPRVAGMFAKLKVLTGSTFDEIRIALRQTASFDEWQEDGGYGAVDYGLALNELENEPTILVSEILPSTGGSIVIDELESIAFSIDAYDLDESTLEYSWELDGNEVSTTDSYDFTTDYTSAGSYIITLDVDDNSLNYTWNITVNDVDQIIVVSEILPSTGGSIVIDELESIAFSIDAYDPDGNTLEYSWELDGEEVSTTDSYDFLTDYTSTGSYIITLDVDDNSLNYTWNITVNDVDQDIVVNELLPTSGNIAIDELESIAFSIDAYDPDGNTLEYSWELEGNEVSTTESYDFLTDFTSAGSYIVTLDVDDNSLNYTWNITVNNFDQPIVINALEPIPGVVTILEMETLILSINAYDPDGNELEYLWKLDGEEVSITDTFDFSPGFNAEGEYLIALFLTDSFSDNALEFEWNVIVEEVNLVSIETIEPSPGDLSIVQDEIVNFITIANNAYGEIYYSWMLDGVEVSAENEFFFDSEVYPIGDYNLQLIVSTDANNRETVQFEWGINVVIPNLIPVADAGEDQFVNSSFPVKLNGSGSYDPEGEILTYNWIAPEEIVLSNSKIVNPTLTFATPSISGEVEYHIQLIVNDGLCNSEINEVIISVSGNTIIIDPIIIPQLTELHNNYPNPFNPTTTIKFDVQDNETATLTIFNVKGQIVENRNFISGTHSFEWDALNRSSGVYYYQLKSSSYTNTKKMILLK